MTGPTLQSPNQCGSSMSLVVALELSKPLFLQHGVWHRPPRAKSAIIHCLFVKKQLLHVTLQWRNSCPSQARGRRTKKKSKTKTLYPTDASPTNVAQHLKAKIISRHIRTPEILCDKTVSRKKQMYAFFLHKILLWCGCILGLQFSHEPIHSDTECEWYNEPALLVRDLSGALGAQDWDNPLCNVKVHQILCTQLQNCVSWNGAAIVGIFLKQVQGACGCQTTFSPFV